MGDLSVTQVPQKPMVAWALLRSIVCEWLVPCPPGLPLGMWGSALQVPGLGLFCSRHGFPCDVYGWGWWQRLSQVASGSCHGPVLYGSRLRPFPRACNKVSAEHKKALSDESMRPFYLMPLSSPLPVHPVVPGKEEAEPAGLEAKLQALKIRRERGRVRGKW